MSTPNYINCLTAGQNSGQCVINTFGELVPYCSQINDKESCEYSYGCYYNGNQCLQIDKDYCTRQEVQNNIVLCRKDQNDFCYFNNGKCQTCNEVVTKTFDSKNPMKLISMDGKRCMKWEVGCKPYYQRGDHPACRKYCEFLEQPNNNTYKCVDCATLTGPKSVAINGKCLSSSECQSMVNGNYTQKMSDKYSQSLKLTTSRTACIRNYNGGKGSNMELALINGKFPSTATFKTEGTNMIFQCPQNYQKVDYLPLEQGESGPTLTGQNEQVTTRVNQIVSSRCICPPGYYINGDQCTSCPSDKTTYVPDSTSCIPKCNENQVVSTDGKCKDICGPNQQSTIKDGVKTCLECKIGQFLKDGVCTDVPKSYYMPLTNKRTKSANTKPLRCPDNTTTQSAGSYSELQCDVQCQNLIDYNGECVDQCSNGTKLSDDNKHCEPCDPGKFYDTSSKNCTDCPRGTYKPELESVCIRCPQLNTTAGSGSTSINDCSIQCGIVGKDGACADKCDDGQAMIDGHCVPCTPGYVSSDGDACLELCPPGEEPKNGTCKACEPGHYQSEASNQSCKKCNDTEISVGGLICKTCGPGEIPKDNKCVSCTEQKKYVANNGTECVDQCGQNEGSFNGKCQSCPAGTHLDNKECKRCSAGQYSTSGATQCQSCTGAAVPNDDQSNCVSCSGATPYLSSDKTTCVGKCAAGEGPTNNICTICKAGTASPDGSKCNQCTGKQFSDVDGAKSCQTCPGGVDGINSTNSVTGNDKCDNNCNPGQSLINGSCQNCPAGTFSPTGAACTKCSGLNYTNNSGQTTQQKCPDNKIPNNEHTDCMECITVAQELPNGTYVCQDKCAPGYGLQSTGNKLCQKCPPGQIGNDSTCTPCPAMTYHDVSTNSCVDCPNNSYSPAGSVKCKTCTGSTLYVDEYNVTCVERCGPSLAAIDGRCVRSPPGKVSRMVHNDAFETCEAMTYSNEDNTACKKCEAGSWSVRGQAQCTNCYRGFVSVNRDECVSRCENNQIENSTTKSCDSCPAGHYAKSGKCIQCEENYQVTPNGLGCVQCPGSTFSNKDTNFKCSFCEGEKILSLDGTKCQDQCNRNEEPKEVKIELLAGTNDFAEGRQCQKCAIGFQSIDGKECVFVQSSYEDAIEDAQRRSSIKVLSIVLPIILILIIVGIVLTVVFVKKIQKKNALKTAKNAFGTQKTVATSLLSSRRQVDSVI